MSKSRLMFARTLPLVALSLLAGCQSLDNFAKLNRAPAKPRPTMISRENVGRAPAVTTAGSTTAAPRDGSAPEKPATATPGTVVTHNTPGQVNVEKAQTLQSQGLIEEALREFEKAIEINPKLTVAYMGAGDIHRQRGDYGAAEHNYATAAQLEPRNFAAQYLHALCLQMLDRIPESVRAYLRALAIKGDDFNANMNIGIAYLQLTEPSEALGYLQKAVQLDPKSAPARTNLGAAYSALNRHAEAVVEYQQAAELTELSGPVLLNLANSLGRCGRYEEMVNTVEQLTKTEPTANAYERLGAGLFHLRRYDESLAAYRKALEIDPNHYPSLNGVGVCLMNEWHWSDQKNEAARTEALNAWRKSVQIERNQPKILELIGRFK